MALNKDPEVNEAPEIIEDDSPKEHMNYELVDKEVAQYANETIVEVDEVTNKRLKSMIDKRVLAVMVVTYFIQALDKGTMSFASIMGIIDDAHLVGQQVRLCGHCYLVGLIVLIVFLVDYRHLPRHPDRRIPGELYYSASDYCEVARCQHLPMGRHSYLACRNEELRWAYHSKGFPWCL